MIQIKCTGSDLLPLDAIEEFQGGLKKRTKEDIAKIIKSIELYGFSFPFFVWNGSGHNYCLDGHGRIQAMAELRRRGEDLPLFPVVYIEAENEEEAKNKLLRLNSQYGQITKDGLNDFTGGLKIEWEELSLGFDPGGTIAKIKTEIIVPYSMVHILLSFDIKDSAKAIELLEPIRAAGFISYEQSAN